MKTALKWFARILVGLLALVGALVIVVGLKFDGIGDYAHGRIQRIAEQSYDDVDRVEIFLLQAPEGTPSKGAFQLRAYGRDYPVYGTATLTGKDASEAAALWTYTLKAAKMQAMCHDPPYGVRMYAGKKLRFETSICWGCSNFWVEGFPGGYGFYGFDAKSKTAQELLGLFDSKLPYPKPKNRNGGEGD